MNRQPEASTANAAYTIIVTAATVMTKDPERDLVTMPSTP
jgi:hypothetical protein